MRDFYHFLFFASSVENTLVRLAAEEAHHAANVLRLAQGDPFRATDGKGTVYTCTCESKTAAGITGLITSRETLPRLSRRLRIVAGLCERTPFETMLVNVTALGVAHITPVVSTCCQKPWWKNDWNRQKERFEAKMVSAVKQSQYPYLPDLDEPVAFGAVCENLRQPSLVADSAGIPVRDALAGLEKTDVPLTVIVGPPGGLTPGELQALRDLGARAVKIGETRLTTELAAVVLCGIVLGAGT